MAKNIVICCDGTGSHFWENHSNVLKLYEVLVRDEAQILYYQPGVGTIGARNALTPIAKWWTRVIGLTSGYGTSENVADAYQFLMRQFEAGDSVYLFGFSRGAYTVRALSGMLRVFGLLADGNEGLVPYVIERIKKERIDLSDTALFKVIFSRQCKPHFLGVWDTVSAVGLIYEGVRFPFTRETRNPDLQIIRHAISIDERRVRFRQDLFGEAIDSQQDVKEVWFAGVHSDVGGSYPEPESQLSKIAFQWMLCEAELAGLRADPGRKAAILGGQLPFVAPNPATKNQHESLRGLWWFLELWPKVIRRQTAEGKWQRRTYLNLGRPRRIPSGSLVHESVEQRLKIASLQYKPSNLPQERHIVADRIANDSTSV
jgi:uncharacterized protein (DUF2235 family)